MHLILPITLTIDRLRKIRTSKRPRLITRALINTILHIMDLEIQLLRPIRIRRIYHLNAATSLQLAGLRIVTEINRRADVRREE